MRPVNEQREGCLTVRNLGLAGEVHRSRAVCASFRRPLQALARTLMLTRAAAAGSVLRVLRVLRVPPVGVVPPSSPEQQKPSHSPSQ